MFLCHLDTETSAKALFLWATFNDLCNGWDRNLMLRFSSSREIRAVPLWDTLWNRSQRWRRSSRAAMEHGTILAEQMMRSTDLLSGVY